MSSQRWQPRLFMRERLRHRLQGSQSHLYLWRHPPTTHHQRRQRPLLRRQSTHHQRR
ncbi:hypothetical protein [Thiolapillus sp.]|uniref:hypothetical protein n=1 Tax=Thiolapillus sp. TaxID=2017437 RepID=UPI003AF8B981